jgi:hypothetical protein
MKKLIIGIIIAIGAFFVVQFISKQSAQVAYNSYLKQSQTDYSVVETQETQTAKNEFINDKPYFSINIPEGLEIEKVLDQGGIIVYNGEYENIMCRIIITDTYTLMNSNNTNYDRKQFDYNLYQKASMDAAYNGLVESVFKTMPYEEMVNRETAIKKLNDTVFIYIKFEVPDEDDNIVRIAYDFLKNGYSISVAGYYLKKDIKGKEYIMSYLNSITF